MTTTMELRFIPIQEALKRCGLPETVSSVRRFRRRLLRAERETGKSLLKHNKPPIPTEVDWGLVEQHWMRRKRIAEEWDEIVERLRLDASELAEKVSKLEQQQSEADERVSRVTDAMRKLASAMAKLARDG